MNDIINILLRKGFLLANKNEKIISITLMPNQTAIIISDLAVYKANLVEDVFEFEVKQLAPTSGGQQ